MYIFNEGVTDQGRGRWSGWSGFGWTTISRDKNKIPFYKKEVINKSIMAIFGSSSYNTVHKKACNDVENNRLPIHVKYFMQYDIFYYAKIK